MTEVREVWKDIPHYEGLYQVSSLGRVWSIRSQKYLKPLETNGYLRVALYGRNGKAKKELIHRLVGMAFIPNPENKPQINHLNEIKYDNRVENLEWSTSKENINYGNRTKQAAISRYKEVQQYDMNGTLLNSYSSLTDASKKTGFPKSGISSCANGNRKHFHNYIWKYETKEV